MKIELIQDVRLVDGSVLCKGAEFDVLEDEYGLPRHGPYIKNIPGFVKVGLPSGELSIFSQEFTIVADGA